MIQEGSVSIWKNDYRLLFGRIMENLGSVNNDLTSGSLIVSPNALPIPRISFSLPEYKRIVIYGFPFEIKGGFSHGWLDKGRYEKAPYLHEKWLYFRIKRAQYSFSLGLIDEAQWAGSTKERGPQPASFGDFIRVVLGARGPKSAIKNERINSLGNHLGIWDMRIGFYRRESNLLFYFQHPFEDHSGANWMLNYKDGLWGVNYKTIRKDHLINDFVLEFLYTLDQSGSEGASDSTYGWDDYYNNYLYTSGWVYGGKVIGTPLFTLGRNKARDWIHIENNRIVGYHTGIKGQLTASINYRLLLTFTKNYGNYFNQDRSKKLGEVYKFDGKISQFSWRYDINFPFHVNRGALTITLSVAGDSGELYTNSNAYLVSFNWVFSL